MAAASTEARELDLVGKVEMRIALAKDDKLESMLRTYLPPLLLKLASDHVAVRNKVLSTCQHIKVRLSGNKDIVLPVAVLLKQYKEHPDSVMVRHFDLMFIQQSINKLTSKEQLDLLPTLLHGLAADAGKPTCATIFNLFLRLLPQLKLPSRGTNEDAALRQQLGLDTHDEDARFVAAWIGKLILLSVVRPAAPGVTCPGLRTEEYNFLTLSGKVETWDASAEEGLNLTQTKIVALNFLASGAFLDEERFLPALLASGDSNSRISGTGDDILKRSSMSLENEERISNLLEVYFTLKPSLQTRLLTLLSKSAISTTFTRQIVRLVQEAIRPDDNTNLPAKGLETIKFRNALFNYMNWVSRVGSKADLAQIAPALVSLLQSYIEDQGWPIPEDKSSEAADLRALAYENLGSLAKSTSSIVLEDDLALVKWLFRSLTEEGSSETLFVSIDGALATLLGAFTPPLEVNTRSELRALLLKYMTQETGDEIVRSARSPTVRWANRCLEYNDILARWIDILAIGSRNDERSDVIEEGKKGLDPYWYRLLNSYSSNTDVRLPDWGSMVKTFFAGEVVLENSHQANTMKTGMEVDTISVFSNFSGTRINAFSTAVNYCRRMLFVSALENSATPLTLDADWERQLDVLYRSDKQARQDIKAFAKTVDEESLYVYLNAAFEGMLRNDGNGLGDCARCFVEVASISPQNVISRLADRSKELLPSIKSNNVAIRFLAAQAFGILAPHPQNSDIHVEEIVEILKSGTVAWSSAVGAEANQVHGFILALGHVLSRGAYYRRSDYADQNCVQDAVKTLLSILVEAKDSSTKEATYKAVADISSAGILSLTQLENTSLKTAGIIGLLAKEAKTNEKAIPVLGRLSLVFDSELSEGEEDHPVTLILNALYTLFELKQPEVHFTVGEAITCATSGWQSDVLQLSVDVDTTYSGKQARLSVLEATFEKILKDCKTPKPSLKKASGIWLFCLIQYCGRLPQIQKRLRECQAAFMGLLSARDELVQETASRGLSLVYEQGDGELRERLVKDLVASFTGSSTQLKVDDDTELFEPGALPTTEGNSVTSYKDIISLADEVGDQSLVYRFMSLASNAATWSTRAAFGRFGLSSILSESAVDPKIYPKLYRYRFDPNPNVQRSMNDIWSALVKDSSTTINEHFDDILDDLLRSVVGKEWRIREASCAALSDLVQGREFDKYEKRLSDIWGAAFKVIDDIKGSVRKAALALTMALTGILVRQLEAGTSSKHAQAMLKEVLPFLLSSQGIESGAEDVRALSTITIIKLTKKGGTSLRPFVPTLIEQLLALLSTMEQEGIDYLYLRAAQYNLTEEKIDNARSKGVSHSPLMEAIERCLDLLDETTMKELTPRLQNAIKTSLGMPSKIGCTAVLVSLATRHAFVFRPYADLFLKITEKAVLDRNNAVSASYARAAGYISRLASDESLIKLASYAKKQYFEGDDENKRQIPAEIMYAISKFATDRFNALASDFLPFIFFAKHDLDEHVREQFNKTWEENVGGSRAVLLYLKEINNISTEYMNSPKWTIKHTAALTIADVVESAGTEITTANATVMWPTLEKALALKTFEGKEKVLAAFVKFVKSANSFWEADSNVSAQIKKIAVREAKRNNDVYRPHAFTTIGEFAEQRTDIDMFDDVDSIITPVLEEYLGEDKMDITDDTTDSDKSIESSTITAGIGAIFKAINVKHLEPSPRTHLPQLLSITRKVISSTKATVTTKLIIYARTRDLFDALRKRTHSQGSSKYDLALGFVEILEIPSGAGAEVLRQKRAEAAEQIVLALVGGVFGMFQAGRGEVKEKIKGWVEEAKRHERAGGVQGVLDRVLKALGEV